jgi:EAL domain-containing protein (putative c-di-GMP-specific phosphodiesterase class I)
MYVAKRQQLGVGRYSAEHDTYDASALLLVAELRRAVDNDELVLHYQCKGDLGDSSVHEVEALVRWQHPTRGLLYPDAFIPLAEKTELVDLLTRWVIRAAVQALPTLDPTGRLAVAVNVSARSLTRPDLADELLAILAAASVRPDRLVVEITETALMSDPVAAAHTLARLHAAGTRVSIDDFGAGQTSLGYLATLPVSELKIDKTFVMSMLDDARKDAIVRSVIELGHSLGCTVTAEGVEDAATLARLRALNCDTAQGYHLARPAPLPDVGAATARAISALGRTRLAAVR